MFKIPRDKWKKYKEKVKKEFEKAEKEREKVLEKMIEELADYRFTQKDCES